MDVSQTQPVGFSDRRSEALGNLRVLSDELVCVILGYLSCLDAGRTACVSSVMYILCTEEPLWMNLCFNNVKGQLQFKGSWRKTTLSQEHLLDESEESCQKSLHFNGFSSLYLYRRFYRCYTTLSSFSFDSGNVERKCGLSLEEFNLDFDGQKPVLVSGLADTWQARNIWTIDHLLSMYGGATFKISQRSSRKITMKFSDYVSYMKLQHDEDPLYIFDEKFGELTPGLLNDYDVPNLFQEDLFSVLDDDQRPPFRWFIIGPERSGASWHVDPALTSAWNTLLCGRKRWALYPPGRVPLGVTVHVNEQDGDVNIETPSSLEWWLDFYPLLADKDKPIEFTQFPGETIYVPSGWWHSVLNLETTIAVTQNYVNKTNFEFVCLDMAPGYHHKGVSRAGLLAIDEETFEKAKVNSFSEKNSELRRKEKRIKTSDYGENFGINGVQNADFCYSIDFLSMFLDTERDHYNSMWSSGNCIGQREMREWLCRLWAKKTHLRDIIWKGACLALNAKKWLELASKLCAFHNMPLPSDDERLPVGTGSNPVYLIADYVVKIYVEGGLEASLRDLGTELEFYSVLSKVNSPLKDHIPDVLATGFISLQNGSFKIESWDGRGVPEMVAGCNFTTISKNSDENDFAFGVWSKKLCDYRKSGFSDFDSIFPIAPAKMWPYIITKRCRGKIFAQIRERISLENALSLASFLGEQLHNLHLLPYPALNDVKLKSSVQISDTNMSTVTDEGDIIPGEWEIFFETLNKKKSFISRQLSKCGDPIPRNLIEKVNDYLPDDFIKLLNVSKDENGLCKVGMRCAWIHSDIMDDNVHMDDSEGHNTWRPTHILDFSDISIGDPICDIIPIHLDIFRGENELLNHLLRSYKLPLSRSVASQSMEGASKFGRLSYRAMCYCIMHDDNILGAIFSLWKELRLAESWEEVEEKVWGVLNTYKGDG